LHPGGRARQVQDPRGVRDRAGGGHTLSTHRDPRGTTWGGGQEGRQHCQGHNHAVGDMQASEGKNGRWSGHTVERRGGTSRLGVSLETHVNPEVKTKLFIVMICKITYLQSKTKGE
jgi:hypothetical protein